MYHILLFHFNAPLLNIFENLLFMAFFSFYFFFRFLFISTQHSDSNILKAMKRHQKRFTISLIFLYECWIYSSNNTYINSPSFTVYLLSASSTFPKLYVSFTLVYSCWSSCCLILSKKYSIFNIQEFLKSLFFKFNFKFLLSVIFKYFFYLFFFQKIFVHFFKNLFYLSQKSVFTAQISSQILKPPFLCFQMAFYTH